MAPRLARGLAFAVAAALLLAVLPVASGVARADYEITEYPGRTGSIVERTGDDLAPSYRYSGEDRFDTAHLIAEDTDTLQADPSDTLATSDTVLLARADLFPDALSGAYLAGLERAPLLLVSTTGEIDEHTREALETISPDRIVILGGRDAVSTEVAADLVDEYSVTRVSGDTRYATAAEVAREGSDSLPDDAPRTAIVASGEVFPDALVAGSLSYSDGLPLLLTTSGSLPDVTTDALSDLEIDEVLLLGGTERISDDVQAEIEALDIGVERVFGSTRVGTATALARVAIDRYGFSTSHVNFARGDAFPDALAMGPHAGEEEAALLLTRSPDTFDDGEDSNATFLADTGCMSVVHVAGGPAAISAETEQSIRQAATADEACVIGLDPGDATNLVGEEHSVTATVATHAGVAVPGGTVTFSVAADDDSTATPEPASATVDVDEAGQASFAFNSDNAGAVTITACLDDTDVCGTATKTFGTDAFVQGLSIDDLMGHLDALQACADQFAEQPGTGEREASSPGYQCSVDYIRDSLIAAGYPAENIEETFFNYVLFEVEAPGTLQIGEEAAISTEPEESPIAYMTYSGSTEGTPVSGPLVGVNDNIVPIGDATSDAGCEAEDFADGDFTGAIAVIQRGTCAFAVKAANAVDAGAVGVIIFNEGQEGRQDVIAGTLGSTWAHREVPVFGSSYDFGVELLDQGGVTAAMTTDTSFSDESSSNLILTIPGTDSAGAIMSGAHLDSVAGGEGINDNGSGSVGLLEIAVQMAELGIEPRNDTYFAWWGAEEHGLVGSTCFVNGGCGGDLVAGRVVDFTLAEPDYTDLGRALLEGGYLNYDMIASPNFMRGIYDGDGDAFDVPGPGGSSAIEATYQAFFEARDLPHQDTDFSGRSDYAAFTANGIAAGGLFTGAEGIKTEEEQELYGGVAGEQYDPNYHDPNDDMYNGWPSGEEPNINQEVFLENTGAAAHAALLFSMSLDYLAGEG